MCHKIHPVKLSSSVVFSICTELYCQQYNLILEYSYHPRNTDPINSLSPFPPHSPNSLFQATTNLLSISLVLPNLDNSYKWNYTMWFLVTSFFHLA